MLLKIPMSFHVKPIVKQMPGNLLFSLCSGTRKVNMGYLKFAYT